MNTHVIPKNVIGLHTRLHEAIPSDVWRFGCLFQIHFRPNPPNITRMEKTSNT